MVYTTDIMLFGSQVIWGAFLVINGSDDLTIVEIMINIQAAPLLTVQEMEEQNLPIFHSAYWGLKKINNFFADIFKCVSLNESEFWTNFIKICFCVSDWQ